MQANDALNLAHTLMKEHGLHDWTFKFDKAIRRFGVCKPRQKVISISLPLTKLNDEARVKNTLLHEIAHALTPGSHHGREWYEKAIAIGCDGQRCYDGRLVVQPKKRWVAQCPTCRMKVERTKQTRSSCGTCSPYRFDE